MPIEKNGEKYEPYLGLKGVKKQVKFRVSSAPHRAMTEEKGMIEKPLASLSLKCMYTMRNASGGYDNITYYEHKTPQPTMLGGIEHKLTPEFMEIVDGEITINTKDKPDLYWWFLNHPDNRNNPLYEGEGGKELAEAKRGLFLFYEVDRDKKKQTSVILSKEVETAKCIALISDKAQLDDKKAVALYRAYGHTDTDELLELGDYEQIRAALILHAKANYEEFNKKVDSAALMLEAQINDAINNAILTYDQNGDYNGWFFSEDGGKPKKVCPVMPHQYEERVQVLMDYLRTDANGAKWAQKIKAELGIKKVTR